MKKQLKKAKINIECLEDDVSFLRDRVNDIENRETRKKENTMKFMRTIVSVSLVFIAMACIYSIFFKQ
ncbi:hypothetical protein [Tenacibaculum ovolyticum]|uniref:hypothetical protein n=1 Tax=Tenacibaculum ovolyticum TaxID=104270 RepID=UPI0004142D01|nr:hypothetical protein [Tenacibaculum ovolyticum]